MVARLLFVTIWLALSVSGCGPQWQGSSKVPSPDGKCVVVVSRELQAANDPESWWQHVSLYRTGEEKENQIGNLLVFSSEKAPRITWEGPRDLFIEIDDIDYSIRGTLGRRAFPEISITTTIKRPTRN